MRLEDMEQEFPKMPEDMRAMVEKEVEKQIKIADMEKKNKKTGNWSIRRAAVVALVATMALGTTVFAGVKIYQMSSEPVGEYGLVTKIDNENSTETGEATGSKAEMNIPLVTMEATYLPKGMIKCEEGIYSYEETPYQGGFSVNFFRMDMGDDAFEILDKDVASSEAISLGGHDGVYLVKQEADGKEAMQHIYLSYPEVHYVMDLYVFQDMTKEEALKFAEGIQLNTTTDEAAAKELRITDWSSYMEMEEENKNRAEEGEEERWTTVEKSDFDVNLHQVGESFSIEENGLETYPGLKAKISDIQITDNLQQVLTPEEIDSDMQSRIGADGTLLPVEIDYMKYGDGINSTNEIVDKKEVPQKFVYATIEYTNEGTEEFKDILFFGTLLTLKEQEDEMKFYVSDIPEEGDEWQEAVSDMYVGGEMAYYDLHSGERDNNYIPSIQPGETVTLHIGFFVTEDMLPYLYLNIDPFGYYTEFSDTGLKMGYIDIRK